MNPSTELAILRLLAGCTYATAAEVAGTLKLAPVQARTFLVVLESMRFVSSCQDPDSRVSRRVYAVTGEGRRKAESSEARKRDA